MTRHIRQDPPGAPVEPGTWTRDTEKGELLYRPLPDEKPETAELTVPVLQQFVRVMGDLGGESVRGVTLENLRFRHADWSEPDNRFLWWDPYRPESEWGPRGSCRAFVETNGANPRQDSGSMPQAAFNCPGAIQFETARDCAVVDCEVARVGFYALAAWRGCRNLRFQGNHLRDLGAGGVIAEGGEFEEPGRHGTSHLNILDNTIEGTGHVFPAACGIALLHAARCTLAHNHIHDLTVEGNLIVRCASNCVHQHFGRQNIYLNNVFAIGDDGVFKIGRDLRGASYDFPPQGTLLLRNVFLGRGAPMFLDFRESIRGPFSVISDANLFWDESDGNNLVLLHEKKLVPDGSGSEKVVEEKLGFKDYQRPDRDGHSRVADPGFTDPAKDDFRLAEDSPARAMGIQALKLADVGPRR